MKPEQIRERILSDHAEIRERIQEIEGLASRFEAGDREVGRLLRERGLALYARFAAHLELEDRTLAALLRASDANDKRADRLAREHQEQRELLRYLMGRLAEQCEPTALVAREIQSFAAYVLHDMQHEEQSLLREEVLGVAAAAASS